MLHSSACDLSNSLQIWVQEMGAVVIMGMSSYIDNRPIWTFSLMLMYGSGVSNTKLEVAVFWEHRWTSQSSLPECAPPALTSDRPSASSVRCDESSSSISSPETANRIYFEVAAGPGRVDEVTSELSLTFVLFASSLPTSRYQRIKSCQTLLTFFHVMLSKVDVSLKWRISKDEGSRMKNGIKNVICA